MILKTLYLKIGDLGLPSDYTYELLKASRFICNYLEREVLKKIRFPADGFNRIVISLSSKPADGVFVNTASVACVDIPFDRETYDSKEGRETALWLIDKLREGIEKCAQFVAIPKLEILEGLASFVSGGMRNQWVHKRRVLSNFGVQASLICELTQSEFFLRLELSRSGKPVFEQILLRTDPDEIAFEHRFKDLQMDGEYLVVTSKAGNPLWRERLSGIPGLVD
jgi:hypothetical protein